MDVSSKRAQFRKFYDSLSGAGLPEHEIQRIITTQMDIAVGRYHGYKTELGLSNGGHGYHREPQERIAIPQPAPRRFPDPIRLPDENALIVGDLHCPYHHSRLLEIAFRVAQAMDMERIVFQGDSLNADEVSTHEKDFWVEDLEFEMATSGDVLKAAAHRFKQVVILPGNHDQRIAKRMDAHFQFKRLVRSMIDDDLPAEILVSEHDWISLGETWDVGHLSQYSRMAGKKASSIGNTRKRHVAVGHDHMQGAVLTNEGYLGVSVGCMLHPEKFFYKERRLNDYPEWQNGFLIIRDGAPYLFSEYGSSVLNGYGKKPWAWWESMLGIELMEVMEDAKDVHQAA
jgi:hypothetical protein